MRKPKNKNKKVSYGSDTGRVSVFSSTTVTLIPDYPVIKLNIKWIDYTPVILPKYKKKNRKR